MCHRVFDTCDVFKCYGNERKKEGFTSSDFFLTRWTFLLVSSSPSRWRINSSFPFLLPLFLLLLSVFSLPPVLTLCSLFPLPGLSCPSSFASSLSLSSLSFFLSYFLFIYSMELHKNLTLDPNSNRDSTGAATHLNLTSTNPMAIPLTQLVPQKQPPSSGVPVHPSTQLSHLASAASALTPSASSLFSTVVTDHHNSYATQSRVGGKNSLVTKSRPLTGPIHGLENGAAKKADRKFAPYWEGRKFFRIERGGNSSVLRGEESEEEERVATQPDSSYLWSISFHSFVSPNTKSLDTMIPMIPMI